MTIGNRPARPSVPTVAPHATCVPSRSRSASRNGPRACLIKVGDTQVLCAATIADRVPPCPARAGAGDRRVLDAAAGHRRTHRPRIGEGPHRRPHPRDPAADRPFAARRRRPRDSANGRSPSTATCSRPMAGRGRRRSRWLRRARRGARGVQVERLLIGKVAAVSVGIVEAPRTSTSTTPRTPGRKSTSTSSAPMPGRTSSCRAPPKASRSIGRARTSCSTWPTAARPGSSRRRPRCFRPSGGERRVSRRPAPNRRDDRATSCGSCAVAVHRAHGPRLAR